MNKLQEQIWARYGSFELSNDKNVGIVLNIEEFITKINVKFAEWLDANVRECMKLNVLKEKRWQFIQETPKELGQEFPTTTQIFEYYINNVYE